MFNAAALRSKAKVKGRKCYREKVLKIYRFLKKDIEESALSGNFTHDILVNLDDKEGYHSYRFF